MIKGELLGDASKMKSNLLTALHFITEAWTHDTNHHRQLLQKVWFFLSEGEYIDVSNDVLNKQERAD